jgi:hypothetical protein
VSGTIEYADLRGQVERHEERITDLETRREEHHADLAVIKTQMSGVLKLLWMILGAVIVSIVAFLAKTS